MICLTVLIRAIRSVITPPEFVKKSIIRLFFCSYNEMPELSPEVKEKCKNIISAVDHWWLVGINRSNLEDYTKQELCDAIDDFIHDLCITGDLLRKVLQELEVNIN